MIVVGAIRLAVVDVECLVGEGFLQRTVVSDDGGCISECAYVAAMAVETIAMIFTLQLTV